MTTDIHLVIISLFNPNLEKAKRDLRVHLTLHLWTHNLQHLLERWTSAEKMRSKAIERLANTQFIC